MATINPAVTATDLGAGIVDPKLPAPEPKADPAKFATDIAGLTVDQANSTITRIDTEATRRRDDYMGKLLKADTGSSSEVYQDTLDKTAKDFGYNDIGQLGGQLRDANSTLARLQGRFRTEDAKVRDMAGTTGAKEGVLGEISRQEAVAVGNQALLVQALQGNYDSARQIALDTANFANNDRVAELNTLIAQYEAVSAVASGEEAQALEAKKLEAEAKKTELERTQTYIDNAIMSGGATVNELQSLTSTTVTDEQKRALAMKIVARVSGEDRNIKNAKDATTPIIKTINGVDYQWNPTTQSWDSPSMGTSVPSTAEEASQMGSVMQVNSINNILESDGLDSAVGTTGLTRGSVAWFDALTGSTANVIADVEQLISKKTMDDFIEAKKNGASFGAMSNAEWDILAKTATKLGNTRVYEFPDKPVEERGRVVGYKIAEKDFKEEVQTMQDLAMLDYIRRGGDPATVGATLDENGKFHVRLAGGKEYITPDSFKSISADQEKEMDAILGSMSSTTSTPAVTR